ncbi:dTDP-4-dehydrorhamnose 3,5-epimerase [Methanolacinia paynteri]|uniref:dTDP-4-dehydrorhamnose 3,5-epimerase n=1 Tax=Methanolacinia paynteri TaxID=230356 RepID=UPI00064EFC28|nr:dTDP-4-dehydrorhamnose 3,5-epimerase [Methanolacinia paynteri]
MSKLAIIDTPIKGLFVVETNPFLDHRGAFARWFCEEELAGIIGNRHIKNVNFSRTAKRGSIRGMHFQRPPHAEMKMVRCIRGKILDVAVDIRKDSPTFLQHHSVWLSAENMRMLVIPEGFAHGFQALEDNSEVLYLVSEFYSPESEGGLRFNDPELEIEWPVEVTDVSDKDLNHPLIELNSVGVQL